MTTTHEHEQPSGRWLKTPAAGGGTLSDLSQRVEALGVVPGLSGRSCALGFNPAFAADPATLPVDCPGVSASGIFYEVT